MQVHIYGVASWGAPVVVEVGDTPLLLLQAERCFLLADPAGVQLLSYHGRPLATPKWQGAPRHRTLLPTPLPVTADAASIAASTAGCRVAEPVVWGCPVQACGPRR